MNVDVPAGMALLLDDDTVLEAALSFLDDLVPGTGPAGLEDVRSPLTDRQDDDSTDSTASFTPKAKRPRHRASTKKQESEEEKQRRKAELNARRKLLRKAGVYGDANRARNERSREIAYLRDQMEKLQLDLEVLKTRQAQEEKEENEPSSTALVRKTTEITGMWQGLAEQQKRRREEAERDNALLRLAVERQTRMADSLRSLMQRRASQLMNECSSLMTLARSKHHAVDVLQLCGDLSDFHGLFQRLEASYRRLDDVFMANGLAGMRVSPVDVHVREGVDGNFFELSTYKTLPFDVRSTAEAAWKHFKGVEKHLGNGSLYQKAEKTDLSEPFTLISDFNKEIVSNSSRADIRVKQAIRRFVEDDRDIIAWTSRVVPIEVKNKLLRGLTYSLRGYAVTQRSPDSTSKRELSVLKLCYMISIDRDIETKFGLDDLRTITDFMIVSIGQNMRAHREFIENALVDQALTAGAAPAGSTV
ncbi:Dynein heavy chain 1 [Phytophthora cinnamomi]|uniref:Dynein heavy chain 1 n=1 Tax=Phytophthora cinnamomi TaxID=4785 RepID=UPI003559ABB8|nr:Dynein heavy chain 1 [Phytophthora cinnamomi]